MVRTQPLQRTLQHLVTRHRSGHRAFNSLLLLPINDSLFPLLQRRHLHRIDVLLRSSQVPRLQHNVAHLQLDITPNADGALRLRRLHRHQSACGGFHHDNRVHCFLLRADKPLVLDQHHLCPRHRRHDPPMAPDLQPSRHVVDARSILRRAVDDRRPADRAAHVYARCVVGGVLLRADHPEPAGVPWRRHDVRGQGARALLPRHVRLRRRQPQHLAHCGAGRDLLPLPRHAGVLRGCIYETGGELLDLLSGWAGVGTAVNTGWKDCIAVNEMIS